MLFNENNSYVNARQYYVLRTLPVLSCLISDVFDYINTGSVTRARFRFSTLARRETQISDTVGHPRRIISLEEAITPAKTKAYVNHAQNFSSYLAKNILCYHHRQQCVQYEPEFNNPTPKSTKNSCLNIIMSPLTG